MKKIKNSLIIIALIIFLSSCSYFNSKILRQNTKTQEHKQTTTTNLNNQRLIPLTASKRGNPLEYRINEKNYKILKSSRGYTATGYAIIYPENFNGKPTNSGQVYNKKLFTVSNNTLPIPSYARIINLNNKKSTIVLVNDRGPFFNEKTIAYISTATSLKLGLNQQSIKYSKIKIISIKPYTIIQEPSISTKYKEKNNYIILYSFKNKQAATKAQEIISFTHKEKILSTLKVNYSSKNNTYRLLIGPFDDTQIKRLKEEITNIFGTQDIKIIKQHMPK